MKIASYSYLIEANRTENVFVKKAFPVSGNEALCTRIDVSDPDSNILSVAMVVTNLNNCYLILMGLIRKIH